MIQTDFGIDIGYRSSEDPHAFLKRRQEEAKKKGLVTEEEVDKEVQSLLRTQGTADEFIQMWSENHGWEIWASGLGMSIRDMSLKRATEPTRKELDEFVRGLKKCADVGYVTCAKMVLIPDADEDYDAYEDACIKLAEDNESVFEWYSDWFRKEYSDIVNRTK